MTFATRAASLLGKLPSAQLRGDLLEGARCYLTGRRHGDGRFGISRFLTRDKHGFEHAAFNQKSNVYFRRDRAGPAADAIYLGRQHSELAEFGAEKMPASLDAG